MVYTYIQPAGLEASRLRRAVHILDENLVRRLRRRAGVLPLQRLAVRQGLPRVGGLPQVGLPLRPRKVELQGDVGEILLEDLECESELSASQTKSPKVHSCSFLCRLRC